MAFQNLGRPFLLFDKYYLFDAIFAQESLRGTILLKTVLSSVESLSLQK